MYPRLTAREVLNPEIPECRTKSQFCSAKGPRKGAGGEAQMVEYLQVVVQTPVITHTQKKKKQTCRQQLLYCS
jgi:hypothetical protein